MKKGWLGVFAVLVLSFLFVYTWNFNLTGNAVKSIALPSDCNLQNISSIWDSIFVESSSEISAVFNDGGINNGFCDYFIATKTVGNSSYVLFGNSPGGNAIILSAKYSESNSSQYNYSYLVSQSKIDSPSERALLNLEINSQNPNSKNRTSEINTSSGANSEFVSVFKKSSILEQDSWTNDDDYLIANESSDYEFSENNYTRTNSGIVFKNKLEASYIYMEGFDSTSSSCTPNWTAQTSSCNSNETKTITYTDSNSCNNNSNKPTDTFIGCDYDSNGIAGTNETVISGGSDIKAFINGSAINFSINYTNISGNQLIEIKKGNDLKVSFNHSFSNSILDLYNFSIIENSDSANLGYLIINGISNEKTIFFTKKNTSSSQVCIYNGHLNSISNMSQDCEEDNEYLMDCPDTEEFSGNTYTCSIENNTISVSGLKNSAVRETILSNCTTNWTCTEWGGCFNGTRTRICTDSNQCGINTGKPNITESCQEQCIPDWSCTGWNPLECYNGVNQTRTCTDRNSCNILTGKPSELNICPGEEGPKLGPLIWWIMGGVILFLIVIIILFFLHISNKKNSSKEEEYKIPDYTQQTRVTTTEIKPSNLPPNTQAPIVRQKQEVKQNISNQNLSPIKQPEQKPIQNQNTNLVTKQQPAPIQKYPTRDSLKQVSKEEKDVFDQLKRMTGEDTPSN